MGLATVVDSLGQEDVITVTRRAAGSYVAGRYVAGSESDVTMSAVVVPATPEDLKKLPEGRRAEKVLVVTTKQELRVADQGGHQADRIAYAGETIEVESVEDFGAVAGYWRALAVKVA